MAQPHDTQYIEKPMTTYGRTQGPSRRYRRLRHPIFLSTEWTAKNPLLQRGEIGAESDTHRLKIGDGVTYWNDLPYTSDSIATWGAIIGNIDNQTDLKNALDGKQDKLTAGSNINITGTTISATDTTYTGSDGITLTGTNFTNSGVRSVSSGTANGTISVNTNGTSADVSVTGLGSAAYTASGDYATSAQGTKADTAVQPGDLATVATTGSYTDLLNKPTLGTAAAANTTDFATAAQGGKADTALQPGDDVSDLNNDAGYQTAGDVATAISGKQDTLTAGTNIQITGSTISATDTTYSNFTGATAGVAGASGLVPAPAAGDQAKFLQGDGTWANPTAATAWGNITGTLSDQTDLQSALNGKADTDMDNLTDTGKNISNWSTNVSNCITEIPQDIKLELNNGTLTLKAGSKVYVPNGVGVFDVVTIANDITFTMTWGANSKRLFFVKPNGDDWELDEREVSFSGGTAPTSDQYSLWYDTTNNLVKMTSNYGSTWTSGLSFPIALITNTNNVTTSIDQVFNGFGYIGSTVFALPGVKGLAPNGRNPDGSLKNNIVSVSSVITGLIGNYDAYVLLRNNSLSFYGDTVTFYRENENRLYDSYAADYVPNNRFIIGHIKQSSSKITAFTPKTPFHAVDYSDTEYIAHQAMPSSTKTALTIGASGTTYTAPADGYFDIRLNLNGGGYVSVDYLGTSWVHSCVSGFQGSALIPVAKGEVITLAYSNRVSASYEHMNFIYANGAS